MKLKTTGFMEIERKDPQKRSVDERIQDYKEFEKLLTAEEIIQQATRCSDCGIPYCHAYGCPIKNRIPDWNDAVFRNQWRRALDLLHSTDNFPEFTGRVCPAPCEAACTLTINLSAVAIKHIELQIVERGWREGWIKPEPAPVKSGKKIAIIGSGPAGLAAAQQLCRFGHEVVVYERADRIGGLLRYGIPDFKLEKWIIDRRLEQMQKEGVVFETSVDVGVDLSIRYLKRTFDAIVITAGSTVPRDLPIPGRKLENIHFAMDFLTRQNKVNAGDKITPAKRISAKDKTVIVIGGGDTGSDCVGTSRRQGARQIIQIELLPKPPENRNAYNPWPTWPVVMRTSSSHEEGCERMWSIMTKAFHGDKTVEKLSAVKLDWSEPDLNGRADFKEIPESTFEIKADLVLLAMGFIHIDHEPLVKDLHIKMDSRGNVVVDSNYMTTAKGIFAAGDSVLGASLVVRAIYQGRELADGVNNYLSNI